jgi:phosphoribosyl 1,2-cyclic phosphodiesterase
MLDCGFPVRETERRLQRLGMTASQVDAIIVTHEHQDHVSGVFKFARHHRIPVWLSYGTYQAVERQCGDVELHFCRDGDLLAVGDLRVSPFTVPHDAREPLQYVLGDGQLRFGVLTDAGHGTPHITAALGGCDAILLECNHDTNLLAGSTYPAFLKQRIGGLYGHLSNQASAKVLEAVDKSRLRTVVAAHLSRQNNTPELVRAALGAAPANAHIEVRIACQDEGFDWVELET